MRHARKARKPRVPGVRGTQRTTLGAVGGGDLAAAAEEIADGARGLAATWAKTGDVVASIRIEQTSANSVTIVADAGAAYPAETRARHPVFAPLPRDSSPRWKIPWQDAPGAPFLAPAAELRAGAAMGRYAQKIDRMCRAAGFR